MSRVIYAPATVEYLETMDETILLDRCSYSELLLGRHGGEYHLIWIDAYGGCTWMGWNNAYEAVDAANARLQAYYHERTDHLIPHFRRRP